MCHCTYGNLNSEKRDKPMKKFLKTSVALVLTFLLLPIFSVQSVFASSEKEFEKAMNNSVVLYLNKGNVLLYGEKSYISDNREITPYKDGNDIYVPIEFFAKSIEGKITSNKDSKATVKVGKKSETFNTKTGAGGVAYASVKELCSAFGYYLSIQDNGLFAYSEKNIDALFDWTTNLHEIREMLEKFLFDDVSGEELYTRLTTNNGGNQHPRLLIDDEKMEMIKSEVADKNGDKIYKQLASKIKSKATLYLRTKTSQYEIRDGIRLLYVSWEASDIIVACSLAYRLTGEEKYAQRAYDEMEAVCAFPDWNPKHYLDVGVMSAGVALGYDWIYNWMTPEQRATIRAGIEKHVIPTILEDMNGCVGERTYQWYKEGNVNNWRCVCAGGVGVAMLSMMDEFEGETLEQAKEILPAMLEAMRPTMLLFAPSGAYEEGFGYWEFAMQNFSYFIKSLEMTTGSDYGYVDLPGMNMATDYFVAANGPVQIFNYHNVGSTFKVFYPAQLMYLADKFNDPASVEPVLKRILSSEESAYGKYDDLFYYDPVMSEDYDGTAKLDAYFPISEFATMRTSLKSTTATFVGLHADRPFGNGGADTHHMDAGQFQLQAKGEVWFLDLGSNGYNVSDIHNTYRFRAEGHNTVIFNPDSDFAMKKHGDVYISNFYSSDGLSYAIAEMTDAYNEEDGVDSFKRLVMLDKFKNYVTVQDEIRLSKSADMYWFAHTDADIEISSDGKSATLTKNGKKIKAYIVNGENATFSVMDAAPLATSPQVIDQDPIADNVKKLTIHIEECRDIDLCVVFATSNLSINDYEFANISDLRYEGDETKQTVISPIESNGDCSSSISLGGFATVIALAGATAIVTSKKRKKK